MRDKDVSVKEINTIFLTGKKAISKIPKGPITHASSHNDACLSC